MSFDNIRLPLDIERGVKVLQEFAVSKVRLANGFSRTLLRQNFAAREWNIAFGLQGLTGAVAQDGILAIYNFYMARGGTLNTWRMRDWLDYQLIQEIIATGDGVEHQYQIQRTLTDFGSFIRVEEITKPSNDAGDTTTAVRVNAAAQVESTDFDIDYTTGIITFLAAGSDIPLTDVSMVVIDADNKNLTFNTGEASAVNVGDYIKISGFVNSKNLIPAEQSWKVITKADTQLDMSLIHNNNLARDLTLGVAEGPIASPGIDINVMTPIIDTHDIDITVDFDRHVSFDKPINFELALTSVGRAKKILVREER